MSTATIHSWPSTRRRDARFPRLGGPLAGATRCAYDNNEGRSASAVVCRPERGCSTPEAVRSAPWLLRRTTSSAAARCRTDAFGRRRKPDGSTSQSMTARPLPGQRLRIGTPRDACRARTLRHPRRGGRRARIPREAATGLFLAAGWSQASGALYACAWSRTEASIARRTFGAKDWATPGFRGRGAGWV